MTSSSRWFWLVLALLAALAAPVMLYFIVLTAPQRDDDLPATLPGVDEVPMTAPTVTQPSIAAPDRTNADPITHELLQHERLLHPWGSAFQLDTTQNILTLDGSYLLRRYPSPTQTLRLAGSDFTNLRLDLWHGRQGVRFEWSSDQTLRGYTLQNENNDPLPGTARLRDRRYYRERTLARIEGPIDFRWGHDPPHSGIDADGFAVRWTGFIHAPHDGVYHFYLQVNDGCRLFINNQLVIDDWQSRNWHWVQGSARLARGWNGFVLEYFDDEKTAAIIMQWEGPKVYRQILPRQRTTPAADDTADWLIRLKPTEPHPFTDPDKQGLLAMYYWGAPRYPTLPTPTAQLVQSVDALPLLTAHAAQTITLDVRYEQGHLVMTGNDQPLMRLPMSSPPDAGLLEYHGRLTRLQTLPMLPIDSAALP